MIAAANKRRLPFKRRAHRAVFIISFLIVPTVHFLLFYVYVNFNSVLMAFQENRMGETVWTLNTMKNVFTRLFPPDEEMAMIFKNTFLTFGINVIMFFIGMFVSYFLYKKVYGYKIFRVLFFLPSVLPGVMMCTVYKELFSTEAMSSLFQKLFHLDYAPEIFRDESFANFAVLLNMVWMTFPGNLLIWGSTFSRVPDSVVEAAKLDGVNWLQEAFRVIIPIVWPTFALLFIMMFAGIFNASGNVFLFTQGQAGTQTLSSWMYLQVYATSVDPRSNLFNFMAALGLVITVISSVIAIALRKVSGKMFSGVEY